MKIQKILPIIFIIIILSGCSSKPVSEVNSEELSQEILSETTETTEAPQSQLKQDQEIKPTEGGTLDLVMRIPKTLNPLINEDYTVDNILKLIFEPLFTLDENLKPIPNLANSYSISEDGKKITITMKDGIYWHNQKPITAEDVVFSLGIIKSNPNSIYGNVLNKISAYSSKANQVFIEYKEPYSWAIYNLCFPIIPKSYYQNNLQDTSFKPIGSGNYKFSSYKLASMLKLEKVSNFKGIPYINEINVLITPDRETDLHAFEKNIIDSLKVNFSEWGKLNSNREKTYTKIITNNFEFLGFNYDAPLYKNIYLRRAIAYAIPKDEIIQNIFLNTGTKATSPINPKAWNSSYNDIENYEYSIEKARQNLALANINLAEAKTTILVNSENEERIETAKLIAKRLEQIGLNVSVVIKPFEEYINILKEGSYHMFLGGIDFNTVPNFESFLTSTGKGEGGINYGNFSDARMDFLIGNMSRAIGEENFLKATKDFEIYFSEQLPLVGLFFKNDILLTDNTVLGNKTPNLYSQYNNIHLWHMK